VRGLALALLLLASPARAARPTIITGAVLGQGLRPLGGAVVRVAGEDCATTTRPNGAFELSCAATGVRALEASSGALSARIEGVEFGPDRLAQLTFLLQPAPPPRPPPASGFSAPLPNPVVTTWQGRPVTLRALGVVMAVVGFLLGVAAILIVARRLGVNRRRLSETEAADLVLNAGRLARDRVRPVASHGARGAEWSTAYGAEELAAALKARRYGLVAASVAAPLLVAVAAVGFLLALLVGQPWYLFASMLLVPAGFVLTPAVLVVQAVRRSR
jgi:hypothetical protein